MYGPEGRILNFNTAWCKVVQSQVSILKHANKIYNEHKNIMFLLNTTYTKILIYIEKVKKMFGPGPTGPYGSYAYVFSLIFYMMIPLNFIEMLATWVSMGCIRYT